MREREPSRCSFHHFSFLVDNELIYIFRKMSLLTAFVIAALAATNAFVTPVSFGTARRSLLSFWKTSRTTLYEKALRVAHNKARTDVRIFLTQRSIQSFIFLLIETRDQHTVTWMEEFGGWTNLESFHGSGALNMTLYPSLAWTLFCAE
jgi:hypothetical protein